MTEKYQRIMEAARGATLIVMSTLGRSGLAHLLIRQRGGEGGTPLADSRLTIRPPAARRWPRRRGGAKGVRK